MRKLVDPRGNPTTINSRQKNAIYHRAKELREQIKDGLCTRRELNNPTDRNVHKMIHGEMANTKKVEEYKKCMEAIGADPGDMSVEKLRRE